MTCGGDVVAEIVGVAALVGVAVAVGVAAVVGVLDEPAAVDVEVAGAGAEGEADEVVVDEGEPVVVEPVVEPECEVPVGVACDWLSASRRS